MAKCPDPTGEMAEPCWAEAGIDAAQTATASKYWHTIVAELQAQQTLAEANRHMIIRLVLAMITYEEASELVQREGLTVTFPNGTSQQHPALSIANAQGKIIRQLEGDLGITATKRAAAAKGKVPGKAKKKPGGGTVEF